MRGHCVCLVWLWVPFFTEVDIHKNVFKQNTFRVSEQSHADGIFIKRHIHVLHKCKYHFFTFVTWLLMANMIFGPVRKDRMVLQEHYHQGMEHYLIILTCSVTSNDGRSGHADPSGVPDITHFFNWLHIVSAVVSFLLHLVQSNYKSILHRSRFSVQACILRFVFLIFSFCMWYILFGSQHYVCLSSLFPVITFKPCLGVIKIRTAPLMTLVISFAGICQEFGYGLWFVK